MPPSIPARAPLGDPFDGAILSVRGTQLLTLAAPPDALAVAAGAFVARYGVRYLGKPHLSVVPGLIVVDYGTFLTGDEAWQFLTRRSNLYPRAEVFGYRNDGRDEMLYIKQLDLAQPIEVLIYADANAAVPIARPAALIAPDAQGIPERLSAYLPRYPTVAAWEAEQST